MQALDQGLISYLKYTYQNVPVKEIRRWNIMDDMRSVAAAWYSMSICTQNFSLMRFWY